MGSCDTRPHGWCLIAWLPHTTASRASTMRSTGSCWTRIKFMTCLRANRQPKRPHTPQRWGGLRATAALKGWARSGLLSVRLVAPKPASPRRGGCQHCGTKATSSTFPQGLRLSWLWRCSCSSAHRPWSSGSEPSSMGASPEPVDEWPVAHEHSGARCQRLKSERHQHRHLAPLCEALIRIRILRHELGGGLCRLIPCL